MPDDIRHFCYEGKEALCLPAKLEAFGTLKTWLFSITAELKLEEELQNDLLICCDEIFTNIASYGYPDPAHEGTASIAIAFNTTRCILILEIRDSGIPFNPLEEAGIPNTEQALEDRDIGGLGIFIVQNLMDDVQYRREDGCNILTMTKHIH